MVIDALSFYIEKSGELDPDYNVTIELNGKALTSANGIVVKRNYTRLLYQQNRDGEWKMSREPFMGTLHCGDELEVAVTVKSNQSREYLMLEDFFPSGMEVLKNEYEFLSRGSIDWWHEIDHKEARDDRMVWFVSNFNEGERTFRYLLRAETPGVFIALPARAELMYEPQICSNSAETTVRIEYAK